MGAKRAWAGKENGREKRMGACDTRDMGARVTHGKSKGIRITPCLHLRSVPSHCRIGGP